MTDKDKPRDKLPDFWLEAQERARQRRRHPPAPRKPGEPDRHLGTPAPKLAGQKEMTA